MGTLAIIALLLAATATLAHASNDETNEHKQGGLKADTEHIFGFTEGADIGKVNDKEFEKETSARFGKRMGFYAASSTLFGFKYVASQSLLISPGALISYHGISGVPGLDDRQQLTLQGLQFEAKYQLLDRERAPF